VTPGSIMAAEIAEQPLAVARTLDELSRLVPAIRELAAGTRSLRFAGRGTSDNAAVYGRYLAEAHAGIPASLAAPSIATHYDAELDLRDTTYVSLSQSGRTEEIVVGQGWARRCGARTVAITNDADSPLARSAELALVTSAGPEVAVPATKSFTAQLAAVAMLVDNLGRKRIFGDEDFAALPAELESLVRRSDEAAAAARALAERDDEVLVTSRGLTYCTALEIALKLEETCLRPVRGLSAADLLHGPAAVVGPGVTVLLVAPPSGRWLPPLRQLAGEIRERGARIVGIGGDAEFGGACDESLAVGVATGELLAPLALTIPGQQFAEALAAARGLNPDSPRGLTKVTQTDRTAERTVRSAD
jgi:glucosamine--fructose-6-phosphate aminotransferase (isomerizing)